MTDAEETRLLCTEPGPEESVQQGSEEPAPPSSPIRVVGGGGSGGAIRPVLKGAGRGRASRGRKSPGACGAACSSCGHVEEEDRQPDGYGHSAGELGPMEKPGRGAVCGHNHGGEPCGHNHGGGGAQSYLHGHSHLPSLNSGHTGLLLFMVIANTVLTVTQIGVSLALNSLALFIDSVDMCLDVIGARCALGRLTVRLAGYALNLVAEWYGHQPGKNQTSRLKLELCSATFTTVCTVGLAIWTIWDAFERLSAGMDRDMELGVPMLVFAAVGLVFNVIIGIPTCSHGDCGQLNLCAAVMHLVGDTVRMIVIFGSGLYITLSGSADSGKIDAWCATVVSVFTLLLILPVIYGLVLTFNELYCKRAKVYDDL